MWNNFNVKIIHVVMHNWKNVYFFERFFYSKLTCIFPVLLNRFGYKNYFLDRAFERASQWYVWKEAANDGPALSGYRLLVLLATCCNSSYLSDVITSYILLSGQKWRRKEQPCKEESGGWSWRKSGKCDFCPDFYICTINCTMKTIHISFHSFFVI